jgi:hypothetical protein
MKQFLLFLLIPVTAYCEVAPALQTPQAVLAHADAVVKLLVGGECEQAITLQMKYPLNPENIAARKPVIIAQLTQSQKNFAAAYGRVKGAERILSEQLGDALIRAYYVQKLEKGVVYWEFIYYKPDQDWLLANVFFNTNADFRKSLEVIPSGAWRKL